MLLEDSFVRLLGLGYVLRFEHLHAKWYFLITEPRCTFFSLISSDLRCGGVFASLATLWDAPQRANVGLSDRAICTLPDVSPLRFS